MVVGFNCKDQNFGKKFSKDIWTTRSVKKLLISKYKDSQTKIFLTIFNVKFVLLSFEHFL